MKLAGSFDLLQPSASYRRHAWIAIFGLLLFFVIYIALASWFTFVAFRMIMGMFAGGDGAVACFFAALPAIFFAVFLWKAFFFVRRQKQLPGVELTPDSQPELFELLHGIADSVHAPRVHRVFASPEVNAAVVYDLSIMNFLVPTKKNLVIGLGLVNTLNRSEFESVLAHEFGHFAQRSMAVGRWANIGEQIASHIIASRDFLDTILRFISTIDLRVAWIGWIMSGIVWAIRSFIGTLFSWVMLAQRALTREMEFQADLVSVVVSGSDAIVHSLFKLQTADDDWDSTLAFVDEQFRQGRVIENLYPLHHRVGDYVRHITNDPTRGMSPKATKSLVFEERLAQPPRMWSTHPANTEREKNAKRQYIAAKEDAREAWSLFQKPTELQKDVTTYVYSSVAGKDDKATVAADEALQLLAEDYSVPIYQSKYQGIYLGRDLTLGASNPASLRDEVDDSYDFESLLAIPYPASLSASMASYRNAVEEHAQLVAIQTGYLEAPSGTVRHRGETIKASSLSGTIEAIKLERDRLALELEQHDKSVRTAHVAAASRLNNNWEEALVSLQSLLHYAEHRSTDIADALGHLMNQVQMRTATGRLSSSGRTRLVRRANDLHHLLARAYHEKSTLRVPSAILAELKIKDWNETLEEFQLPPATADNLHQWIPAISSWAWPVLELLNKLKRETLNELLRTEEFVAQQYRSLQNSESRSENSVDQDQTVLDIASVPVSYETRLRGTERERETKLDWWSRFVTGEGTVASAARMVVATSVVGAVAVAGILVGGATLIVNNALNTHVSVRFNNSVYDLQPKSQKRVNIGSLLAGKIESRTKDGRVIDDFEVTLGRGYAKYIYNVAGAVPLYEWTAVYGDAVESPPEIIGAKVWHVVSTQYAFEDPPVQVSIKGKGTTRSVTSGVPLTLPPTAIVEQSRNDQERKSMIMSHVTWDNADSPDIMQWIALGAEYPEVQQALDRRLSFDPYDVVALRWKFDLASEDGKEQLKDRFAQQAKSAPGNADLTYMALRCQDDSLEQDLAFIAAAERWPENVWLANASALSYSRSDQWEKALNAFQLVIRKSHPLQETAIINSARIRRHVDPVKPSTLEGLPRTEVLQHFLDIESKNSSSNPNLRPYMLLAKGEIEAASQALPLATPAMKILLGASSGASERLQQAAVALNNPTEIADLLSESRVYLAALLVRLGKEPTEVLRIDNIKSIGKRSNNAMMAFADWIALSERNDPNSYLAMKTQRMDVFERGVLIAAFITAYPNLIEPSWKSMAKDLLFATERPFW